MHQLESSLSSATAAYVNKSGLKRKRLHNYNQVCENLSDGEEAIVESLHDCSSNSSSSSSVSTSSSTGSFTFKLNKVQNGHKLLITEETMSNALKDLCMESEMCSNENAKSLIPFESINDHDDGDEPDECPCVIQLSDELKSKLKEYNNTNLFSNLAHNQNNMQLVIWSPRVELRSNLDNDADCESGSDIDLSSSDASLPSSSSTDSLKNKASTTSKTTTEQSTAYKIEEPLDSHAKNKLKRKYSQLNKISIEELATSKHDRDKPSFYLVDQFESATGSGDDSQNLIYLNQTKTSSNVKITEIVNHDASEPMDI